MESPANETEKSSDAPGSKSDPEPVDDNKDEVDEQSEESFPASDPPSY